MNELVARQEVTEKQAALVDMLTLGISMKEASRMAGYATEQGGNAALRSKTVALLLHQRMAARLAAGAPVMFATLQEIATNRAAPAGARVDAAKAWLDRAGWTVPRMEGRSASDGKGLSELSLDELRGVVLELKAVKDAAPADDPDGLFT